MIESTQGAGKGASESWPPVHIRNLDPSLWTAMKVEALQRRLTLAQLVAFMWRAYNNHTPAELGVEESR